jgi:DoxX-like protein
LTLPRKSDRGAFEFNPGIQEIIGGRMFTAYLIVTVLTAVANIFSATCDFVRYKQVSIAMAKAGVPDSWMTTLGILKAAGALGLLLGIGAPLIGTAAAVGLILFFVAAIITHLRTRDYSFALAIVFLLLAVAALVLGLYGRGNGAATIS